MVVVEAQVNGLPVLVSEAVPNEAKVNCNINFCNLNKPPAYWRNSIIQISKKERFKSSMIVDNNNFDIRYESKNIEKIYLKLNYFIAEE